MKKVFETPPMDPEAGLLKDILEKEGIECEIRNQGLGAAMGVVPVTECYAEVWVLKEEDAARAEEIVRDWRRGQAQSGTWKCPKCGELVEEQFTSCWKCGAPRETVTP
jgi:hypothetical protein